MRIPYFDFRLDAVTTPTKPRKELKCKIEQCGGRCLRAGEVCRLNPSAQQKQIHAGAVKSLDKKEPDPPVAGAKPKSRRKTKAEPTIEPPLDAETAPVKPSRKRTKAIPIEPAAEQKPTTGTKPPPPSKDKPTEEPSGRDKKDSAPVNQKELDKRRSELVKKYGEKLISDAEKSLENALKNSSTYIRVHGNETLNKIIDSGRFKTLFETGTGNATAKKGVKYMKDARKKAEKYMFSQDKIDDSDRAIYGYIARDSTMDGKDYEKSEARGVGFYGNVAVKLKSGKAQNTTFTSDDSLSTNPPPMAIQPSPINKPNIATLFENKDIKGGFGRATKEEMREMLEKVVKAKDIGKISEITGSRGYIEAQIHGQVKTSDFEELVYMDGEKPDKKVVSWAKANNVKITVKK